jgi:hypothetical protein
MLELGAAGRSGDPPWTGRRRLPPAGSGGARCCIRLARPASPLAEPWRRRCIAHEHARGRRRLMVSRLVALRANPVPTVPFNEHYRALAMGTGRKRSRPGLVGASRGHPGHAGSTGRRGSVLTWRLGCTLQDRGPSRASPAGNSLAHSGWPAGQDSKSRKAGYAAGLAGNGTSARTTWMTSRLGTAATSRARPSVSDSNHGRRADCGPSRRVTNEIRGGRRPRGDRLRPRVRPSGRDGPAELNVCKRARAAGDPTLVLLTGRNVRLGMSRTQWLDSTPCNLLGVTRLPAS